VQVLTLPKQQREKHDHGAEMKNRIRTITLYQDSQDPLPDTPSGMRSGVFMLRPRSLRNDALHDGSLAPLPSNVNALRQGSVQRRILTRASMPTTLFVNVGGSGPTSPGVSL
jgi:hypothetical protein